MPVQSQRQVENELKKDSENLKKQPKVDLFIAPDRQNPSKHRYVGINGQEYILAVGKHIKVPQVVADVWNESYAKTIKAENDMNQFAEI